MTTFDVETDDRHDPDQPTERPGRRRRRWLLAGLVVAVPVVALVAVLGVRATDTTEADLTAAEDPVAAAVQDVGDGGGFQVLGRTGGPDQAVSGFSGVAPDDGVLDLTVVCASAGGRAARLTVQSGGRTVADEAVECAVAGAADLEPARTRVAGVEVTDEWSFEVVGESPAVVAVVES